MQQTQQAQFVYGVVAQEWPSGVLELVYVSQDYNDAVNHLADITPYHWNAYLQTPSRLLPIWDLYNS